MWYTSSPLDAYRVSHMQTSHPCAQGARLSFSRSSLKRSRTFSSLLFRARSSLRRPECTSYVSYESFRFRGDTKGFGSFPGDGVATPEETPEPTTPRGDDDSRVRAFGSSLPRSPFGPAPAVTLVAANERARSSSCVRVFTESNDSDRFGSIASASANRPSVPMAFSDASNFTNDVAVHVPSGLRRGFTAFAKAFAPSSPARLPPTPSARSVSFAAQCATWTFV
mmetsp:Transcript_4360/g.18575  ORF Transcript_4360/g.18575 Transcript_4360/m.18575 type:complete len:224 (+) Transcript_4360:540-1211(+)